MRAPLDAGPPAPATRAWAPVVPDLLGWGAMAALPVAAVVMAFHSGGYFTATWGTCGVLFAGLLAAVVLAARGGVGGTPGVAALVGWAGLALWQGASAWWAADAGVSQQVMGLTLTYGAAFAVVMFALRAPEQLRWLALGVLGAAVIPVAAALGGRLLPGAAGHDTFARLTWPITYWNGLGALAAFALVLAIGLGGGGGLPVWGRAVALATMPVSGLALYLTLSRGAILVALVAVAVMVAVAPGRLETLAAAGLALASGGALAALAEHEGGLVSLGPPLPAHASQGHTVALFTLLAMALCAGVGIAAVWGLGRLASPARRAVGIGVAAVLAVAVIGGWVTAGHAQNPVTWAHHQITAFKSYGSTDRNNGSVQSRLAVAAGSGRWQNWNAAWHEWETAPVVGTGAGDYRQVWNQRRPVTLTVVNAHSLYLETLGESGVVGLLLMLLPMGVAAAVAPRALRALRGRPEARDIAVALCAAGVMAVHAAGDWDWQLPAVMLPAVVLGAGGLRAALAAGGAQRAAGWRLRGATLAVAAIGALLLTTLAGAATLTDQGRDQARAGHLAAALSSARDALRLQPSSTDARLLQANVLADLGRPAQSDRAFAAAVRRAPHDWHVMADWASALIARRQIPAARPLLLRARTLNPREPRIQQLLARVRRA